MSTSPHDAALGSILGALVGDAAGGVLEFLSRKPTGTEVDHALTMPGGGVFHLAPGQITDDGELTLCLAQGLAGDSRYDPERVASMYARWIASPPFDIGNTTRSSLGSVQQLLQLDPPAETGFAVRMTESAARFCQESKANGSLMRATPLGIWGSTRDDASLAAWACQDSSLSHPNETCWQTVACYVMAIADLINRRSRDQAFHRAKTWALVAANDEVREWLALAERNENIPCHPESGFVKIAFVHAFRHLKSGTGFVEALRQTLLGGGDTDTNACIVGGLIGAADGLAGIPATMREAVLTCNTTRGSHPRPDFLHPRLIPDLIKSWDFLPHIRLDRGS